MKKRPIMSAAVIGVVAALFISVAVGATKSAPIKPRQAK